MSEPSADPADETIDLRLAEVLEQFTQELAQGHDPDPDAYLAAHPELAPELGECLQGLAALTDLPETLYAGPPAATAPPPATLGQYELLGEIGRGGMGIVYRARQVSLDRLVALKMIRAADMAAAEDVQRFRNEAAIVAGLDHPGIVPVYEVGEDQGQLYYSMKLIEGGSLASWIAACRRRLTDLSAAEERKRQRLIAQWLIQIAGAVHHAHQRGILHRDLKPANILLQAAGSGPIDAASVLRDPRAAVPMVTDFGLAKRVEADSDLTQSGALVGTPGYMAPEQTAADRRAVTTSADLYGLGGILYAMLTGQPPCQGATLLETLTHVRDREPSPPRTINRRTDRDLETICLKCLRKEPGQRYGSAFGLVRDLERWLEGKPIEARRTGPLERFGRWCRRHPAAAGLTVLAVVLLLAVTVRAVTVAQARAVRLEEEVLRGNVYAAQGVASTVLWQLQRLSVPVAQTAESADLRRLLQAQDRDGLRRFFMDVHRRHADPAEGWVRPGEEPPYTTWYVLDRDGHILAIAPPPQDEAILGRDFSGRDYFRGALAHARDTGRASVHISRVFLAENLNLYKFAIAAPVRAGAEADAPVLGVVAATIPTTSTLGALRLHDQRHTVALVGRRDSNPARGSATSPAPVEYLVLLHPAYRRGEAAVPIRNDRLQAIHRPRPGLEFQLPERDLFEPEKAMDSAYEDPLAARDPTYGGRWLAGFAPVGNTEFIVVVQQRYDDVVDPDLGLLRDLLLWGGIAVVLSLLCLGSAVVIGLRRALVKT